MDESPTLPFWIRGLFRLDDGREITRTIRSEAFAVPGALAVEHAIAGVVDALRAEGYDFPEGHGVLVEVFGTMHG